MRTRPWKLLNKRTRIGFADLIFLTALSPYVVFTTDSLDKLGKAGAPKPGEGGQYKVLGKPYEPTDLIREIRQSLGEGSENDKTA